MGAGKRFVTATGSPVASLWRLLVCQTASAADVPRSIQAGGFFTEPTRRFSCSTMPRACVRMRSGEKTRGSKYLNTLEKIFMFQHEKGLR